MWNKFCLFRVSELTDEKAEDLVRFWSFSESNSQQVSRELTDIQWKAAVK